MCIYTNTDLGTEETEQNEFMSHWSEHIFCRAPGKRWIFPSLKKTFVLEDLRSKLCRTLGAMKIFFGGFQGATLKNSFSINLLVIGLDLARTVTSSINSFWDTIQAAQSVVWDHPIQPYFQWGCHRAFNQPVNEQWGLLTHPTIILL